MRDAGLISDPDQVPSVLIDKQVPVFRLQTLTNGNSGIESAEVFSNQDLVGNVSIVNIWASWCGPCRAEHPILMELAKDERIQVFGLNYKDKPKNALKFLEELGNPFKLVGSDRSGRVGIDWGVYGVPETFVIGSDGVIRHKFIGPLTKESTELKLLPMLENLIESNI